MIEVLKEEIDVSLRETEVKKGKNWRKLIHLLKEAKKKQLKRMNKTVQVLKLEIEATKKTETRQVNRNYSCKHHKQNTGDEERISGIEDKIETDMSVKESIKCKIFLMTRW